MVLGSARNWIAVDAVKPSNENKKYDNDTFKKITSKIVTKGNFFDFTYMIVGQWFLMLHIYKNTLALRDRNYASTVFCILIRIPYHLVLLWPP